MMDEKDKKDYAVGPFTLTKAEWGKVKSYYDSESGYPGYVIAMTDILAKFGKSNLCSCSQVSPIDALIAGVNYEGGPFSKGRCVSCNSRSVLWASTEGESGVTDFTKVLDAIVDHFNCGHRIRRHCAPCNARQLLQSLKRKGLIK